MALLIKTIPVGFLQTNCYIISCDVTGFTYVIDPGENTRLIDQYLTRGELYMKGIVLTHAHRDHIGGVKKLQNDFNNIQTMIHQGDLNMYTSYGGKGITQMLSEGMILRIGRCSLRILHTPGHSRGSCCFYGAREDIGEATPLLFSGDTLFYSGVGRTDLEGGSQEILIQSLSLKLFTLPPETIVFPGHGERTTIRDER